MTSSLRSRIRNGTLLLLALVIVLGAYALPRLSSLGGAIRETLYRNYISIEVGQHQHADLRTLQLAERDGTAQKVLPAMRDDFMHWMDIEQHDITEVGEPEVAGDIQARGQKLFDAIAAAPPGARHDEEFDALHGRIDDLIAMNKAAMFRADSRALKLGTHLTYEVAAGFAVLLVVGAALSIWMGAALSRPLTELAERLRGISQRKTHVRLGPQTLAELDEVAREFNQMAERLEHYDRMNVERIVYEKSKTEAIIESLEDGVVLLDQDGVVAHINQVAALIVGIEPSDALGSRFDDLSSNHPHYLRVRDAIRNLSKSETELQRVEVQLHIRGRDHSYVL
ncbi:MAG TPA: PAS domain-containing protein, partial [Candidatus Binataceae bacterium]|nr:PAS domain-containing protein [Candidatus Binataceae bacterium]